MGDRPNSSIRPLENASSPRSDLGWSHGDRRTMPRYSVVVAEFAETESIMCIEGTVTEISRKACYVSTPSTLPVNTLLKVFISHDGRTFTTSGKVIYAHGRFGMGIAFVDSTPEQLELLNSWLADAA
jgi:PilZ domain